jgi:predicted DNA-binding ribbon-helix-helix protein
MKPEKRSFTIAGHRTSISLEQPFWEALREIAGHRNLSLAQLVAAIDTARGRTNLSSAVRVHILEYYRNPARPA